MDDREALYRAVLAAPDDDLPRLVYADWLEERGEADQAAFIRAQCELARTPDWEPFAVFCRHRRSDWVTGRDWRHTLPAVPPDFLEWHPDRAFRRGFGWSLIVRDLTTFLDEAPRLFDAAPIGELHLPTATLDEWRRFAVQLWLPGIRRVHFYSIRTPIEPIRVLCESPLATGIKEIVFEKAGGHGFPEILSGLVRSPLGRQLRGLGLHVVGAETVDEVIDALTAGGRPPPLARLTLVTVDLPPESARRLAGSGALDGLDALTVRDTSSFGDEGFRQLVPVHTRFRPANLNLAAAQIGGETAERILSSPQFAGLRELDLSRNTLGSGHWANFRTTSGSCRPRVIRLGRCRLQNLTLRMLTGPDLWPNLAEIDLRENQVTDDGAEGLLRAPVPPPLAALLIAGNPISSEAAAELRDKFGDALIPG